MAKHIVLIENDDDFRWVVTLMLEELGHRVTSFAQVEDIEALIALSVDLFMVDENLPGINGHILCIVLKSKLKTKEIPLILISGSTQLVDMASLSDADGFLAKPFTQEDLQNALAEVVQR
jgi:CheY-like chemotaxis protein